MPLESPKAPFLSIVVPVYNAEAFLATCVDSILAQTYRDFELILVNDGSTDSSQDICEHFAGSDSRVKVVHKENEGRVRARKTGLQMATGRYIGFVDADDWISANMYAALCAVAIKEKSDIVVCNFVTSTPDGETPTTGSIFPPGTYTKSRLTKVVYPRMLMSGSYGEYGVAPAMWNKILARDLLEGNLARVPDHLRNGEDGACTYPCLLDAASVTFLSDHLYYYRQHHGQTSKMFDAQYLKSIFDLDEHLRRAFSDRGAEHLHSQLDRYFVYKLSFLLAGLERTDSLLSRVRLLRRVGSDRRVREIALRTPLEGFPAQAGHSLQVLRHGAWYALPLVHPYLRLRGKMLAVALGIRTRWHQH